VHSAEQIVSCLSQRTAADHLVYTSGSRRRSIGELDPAFIVGQLAPVLRRGPVDQQNRGPVGHRDQLTVYL